MEIIERMERVRDILGTPNPLTAKKIQNQLNRQMQDFIARSPLVMLSTVDEAGFPTVSPKGDHPGFVKIRDAGTLLIPERKGNKLAFTFENLLRQPRAGLLFIVPGTAETLRVHGRCRVIHDSALGRELASATQDALLVIELSVVSCYFHCGKALLRGRAWDAESWPPRQRVSFGAEIAGTDPAAAALAEQIDSAIDARYQADL